MIDDGSQDSSSAICQSYSNKDTRFKYIHQKNKGPSAARNKGLKQAEGRYLCFVDSDDYVTSDYLVRLHDTINERGADVVFLGYHRINRTGNIIKTYLPPTELRGRELVMKLSERDMFGYTWIKCFFRECVGDCLFPEDMFLFEDEVFTCSVMEKAQNIAVLPAAVYYHVTGEENMLTARTYQNYCQLSDRVYSAWEHLLHESSEGETFLMKKANYFVGRCRYYGLERDVDSRLFFESLAKTGFFRKHTDWNVLDRFIQRKNWLAVRAVIIIYRIRTGFRTKRR